MIGKQPSRMHLLVYLFCLTLSNNLSAQKKYEKFEHLTINEGLLSNRIKCILRDSEDYLWIGTDAGLNKYDSYECVSYKNDKKQSGSLSSNCTTSIYEGHDKKLWFGTDDGLNLFNPAKNNFVIFRTDSLDSESLGGNYISSIAEDKNGKLWVLTDGNCLNRWNKEAGNFTRYPIQSTGRIQYSLPAKMIAADSKGYLWVVSFGSGILRFDPDSGIFEKFSNPSFDFGDNCYKSLYIDQKDKIWITTSGNGFFSYDPTNDRYEKYLSNGNGKGTNGSIILDVIREDENHLLLAVDHGGLNRFDKVSGTFEYIRFDPSNSDGLNNDGIWCLYIDKEGILWIGTSGGGINYSNPKKARFQLFRHNENNPNSLIYNPTTCFYEDSNNLIWIGTDGGGVSVYDPVTGNFTNYKHNPSDPLSISGNTIRSIAEDQDGVIWIGSWDGGLCRFDRKSGSFSHETLPEIPPTDNTVLNLYIDHENILWLSILNEGVIMYNKKKGIINKFKSELGKQGSISDNQSTFFYEDSENTIWISTPEGINIFDRNSNSFEVLNFPDNDIWALYIEPQGNMWVGTFSSGIYYCKKDGSIIERFNTENGLPDNSIKAITADNNGNIWFSSNHGISRLDAKMHHIRNYTKEDGLQSNQFLQQSFLKTSNGEIYFGGTDGFNSFNPEKLKDNSFKPPIHFTDFQISNKPVEYGGHGSQFQTVIDEAKEITLTWRQSVFSFSFAAINFTSPEKNKYAYRMTGFDKDWNYADASRRFVMYTNLSPGKYVFNVKASNNDEVWNDTGVSLAINILPPWWKTLLFKLVLSLTLIILISSVVITRITSLKRQQKLLEDLVAKKTLELKEKNAALVERQLKIEAQKEDLFQLNASKDRFFSIIAHDLRSPFNSIIGLSQILKMELDRDNYSQGRLFAGLINTTAEKTLGLLENLLEWANIQRGKIEYNPVKVNLTELIQEELNLLSDISNTKNIELKCSVPEKLIISADRNMLKTIVRNLIVNAIKFTHRNGEVLVKSVQSENGVEIIVSDNGVGMTEEILSNLFRIDVNHSVKGTENEGGTGLGLFLCKEFVELHNGKICAKSEKGKGSTFNVFIPSDVISPESSN